MEAAPAVDGFVFSWERVLGRRREVVEEPGLDRLRGADQISEREGGVGEVEGGCLGTTGSVSSLRSESVSLTYRTAGRLLQVGNQL